MKQEHINQIQLYISNTLCHPIDNHHLILLYYQIGVYLGTHDFSSHELKILEWELRQTYGIVIGFTKRNFLLMVKFYHTYLESDLPTLEKVSWNQHLQLLKRKDIKERKELLTELQKGNTQVSQRSHPKKINNAETGDYMLFEMQKLQQKLLCNQ